MLPRKTWGEFLWDKTVGRFACTATRPTTTATETATAETAPATTTATEISTAETAPATITATEATVAETAPATTTAPESTVAETAPATETSTAAATSPTTEQTEEKTTTPVATKLEEVPQPAQSNSYSLIQQKMEAAKVETENKLEVTDKPVEKPVETALPVPATTAPTVETKKTEASDSLKADQFPPLELKIPLYRGLVPLEPRVQFKQQQRRQPKPNLNTRPLYSEVAGGASSNRGQRFLSGRPGNIQQLERQHQDTQQPHHPDYVWHRY